MKAIKKDKRVAYVERDQSLKTFAQILPWGVERVSRQDNNWSSTRPGDGSGAVGGVHVYVVDTGIDPQPDLNGVTEVNTAAARTPTATVTARTCRASSAPATTARVWSASRRACCCTASRPSTATAAPTTRTRSRRSTGSSSNGQKPGVVTMSFGGPISAAFDEAVRRTLNAGFVVVAAAGNDGADSCKKSPAHMGSLDGVITVGASSKNDRPAGFSDWGPCVDVYAPGVRITSTYINSSLAIASGTSASAPHVAGAAALYLSGNGGATPAAVESAIKSKAITNGKFHRLPFRRVSRDF